jgi:FkbM family methyltransferase
MEFELFPKTTAGHLIVPSIKLAGLLTRRQKHKGLWQVARALGKIARPDQFCIAKLGHYARFRFPLADPYWSRLLCGSYEYEPEIAILLRRVAMGGLTFSFYDLGANLGYWSVFCTDDGFDCPVMVALEISPDTFEQLEANRTLNGDAFVTLRKAIYSQSGRSLHVQTDGSPANSHVSTDVAAGPAVETITIDDLFALYPPIGPAIVKLDVEGAEIAAFEGAQRTLESDAMFIYEDHGADPDSKVTEWLLANTNVAIYFIHEEHVVRIGSAEEASSFKPRASVGYNFFALTPRSSIASALFVP